ncbi:hypothetical protein N7456_007185 [Penicillium angulare]|uniref:Uncharacterized protein n=1 Tax=Penicillium angulare TaxID=116970 RepID=A0A9W9FJ87_9EURO|nr:hypothetical protein N7456_007185 [Penicillium angulare]
MPPWLKFPALENFPKVILNHPAMITAWNTDNYITKANIILVAWSPAANGEHQPQLDTSEVM